MALPKRNGIKLVTQFANLVTRDFDTNLSLSATATIPVTDGEFFIQDSGVNEGKLKRPAAIAKQPSWASFQERGRYDVQAIAPRGRITVLYMGPYEADFKTFDLDDAMAVNTPVTVDMKSPATLDNLDRGLLTSAGVDAVDVVVVGWVTRAKSGGVVRVYCPNVFIPKK